MTRDKSAGEDEVQDVIPTEPETGVNKSVDEDLQKLKAWVETQPHLPTEPETGVNKSVDEDLQKLKAWVETQPHLPNDLGEAQLLRFLHSCYYDLEKTKTTVHLFCTLRSNMPELLDDRDPLTERFDKSAKITNIGHLQISGNRNLWVWQLNDPGLYNYDYVENNRLLMLSTDAWLLNEERLQDGDVGIMDLRDMSLKMFWKINMSVAKKIAKFQQEAMPYRLKQMHFVNSPPYIDRLYAFMKPFMSQEMIDVMTFHLPNSETLFQHLDKSDVPEDFGGTFGKMEDHTQKVLDKIRSKRDLLTNDDLWKAVDLKKMKNTKSEPPVVPFKSLAID